MSLWILSCSLKKSTTHKIPCDEGGGDYTDKIFALRWATDLSVKFEKIAEDIIVNKLSVILFMEDVLIW